MDAGYILLACLLIASAIGVHLWRRRNWHGAISGLRPNDIAALSDIAGGNYYGIRRDRLVRLCRRGLAVEDSLGGCRPTLKGKLAARFLRKSPSKTVSL